MSKNISITLATSLKSLLEDTFRASMARGAQLITVDCLLYTMVSDNDSTEMLEHCGADVPQLRLQLGSCVSDQQNQALPDSPLLLDSILHANSPGTVLAGADSGLPIDSRQGFLGTDLQHVEFYRDCTRKISQIADEVVKLRDRTTLATNQTSSCNFAGCLERSLLRASFLKAASGQASVNEADVLSAMFDETDSAAVSLLKKQGVSRIDIRNYISHRISKLKTKATEAPRGFFDLLRRYNVVMHSDNFTTMEFVVYVLQSEFNKSLAESHATMIQVHEKGKAVVGSYSYDAAKSKIRLVTSMAQAKEFPLLCTIE